MDTLIRGYYDKYTKLQIELNSYKIDDLMNYLNGLQPIKPMENRLWLYDAIASGFHALKGASCRIALAIHSTLFSHQ